jgi:hypothetical protein
LVGPTFFTTFLVVFFVAGFLAATFLTGFLAGAFFTTLVATFFFAGDFFVAMVYYPSFFNVLWYL